MVNGRSRKKGVTRDGTTIVPVGKEGFFIFKGTKLKTGTIGIFGDKGQLRMGVFRKNGKKSTPRKRSLGKRTRKKGRKGRSSARSLK